MTKLEVSATFSFQNTNIPIFQKTTRSSLGCGIDTRWPPIQKYTNRTYVRGCTILGKGLSGHKEDDSAE